MVTLVLFLDGHGRHCQIQAAIVDRRSLSLSLYTHTHTHTHTDGPMAAIYAAIGGHWVRNGNAVPARYAPHGTSKQKKTLKIRKKTKEIQIKKRIGLFISFFFN